MVPTCLLLSEVVSNGISYTNFQAMVKAQPDITALQPLQSATNLLKFVGVSMCAEQLICDTSTTVPCPTFTELPKNCFQSQCDTTYGITVLCNISHPGVQATQHFITFLAYNETDIH